MSGAIAFYTKTWLSSGAGLFAQALADGMADGGGDVVFIAPPAEAGRWEAPRPRLTRIRTQRELRGGSRFARLLASVKRIASGWLGVLRARARARVFIISIPDPLIFAVPLLALLRLTGARVIYVVHDPLPHAWKLPASLRWLERGTYCAAYRLSNALVVLSASSAEALRRAFDLGKLPVTVIEHGVFALDTVPPPLTGEGVLLLFGSLRRNKGIRQAIEGVIQARAAGAAVRLVIAGAPHDDDRAYWHECAALAAAHPDAIRVEPGYVEDAALARLIAECDAFLMPYQDFHSQSGVAILAASNARPLIATAAGGVGDLIAEGLPAAVISSPVTGGSVADAILAFSASPAKDWSHRAIDYRDVMNSKRSWSEIGRRYVELAAEVNS